jgi:hypothetical protein
MATGKVKFGKIAIVVFITMLIWVYADLALDEQYEVYNATLTITRLSGARLWVSFEGESSTRQIKSLVLGGPASKITQFVQELNKGNISLDFPLFPDRQNIREQGRWPVSVASVINDSEQMRQWGLRVEESDPENVTVTAAELVQKTVNIRCEDENGAVLASQNIDPAQIEVSVPDDWGGEAYVRLTAQEVRQARSFAVEKIPLVRVGEEEWQAQRSVKVTMPADTLREGTIQNVTLGVTYSLVMQGKYTVVIEDQDLANIIGPILVKATPEAREEYENNTRYQVILEIDDSLLGEEFDKVHEQELIYNFPEEYVSRGEIILSPTQTPVIAKFKLVPVASEPSPPVAEE